MDSSPSWRLKAVCFTLPEESKDWFFSYTQKVRDKAVSICQGCPVQSDCLAEARANREQHGVWGGLDFTAPEGATLLVCPVCKRKFRANSKNNKIYCGSTCRRASHRKEHRVPRLR